MGNIVYDFFLSFDFSFLCVLFTTLVAFIVIIMMRKKRVIKVIVWLAIFNIFFQILIVSYFFRSFYLEIIDRNCLFGIDRYNCGGTLSKFLYYTHLCSFYLSFIFILIISLFFNRINLIISFIKTSFEITRTL